MSTRIRLFSNGDEYRSWSYNNCSRCVKRLACDLEEAIASACVLDGTVGRGVAQRLGVPSDGRERWWCRELHREDTRRAPTTPAEAKVATCYPLPGFEPILEVSPCE